MEYLTVEDLLAIAEIATGVPGGVRDLGLLSSAAHRPQASAFGWDAYPSVHQKAAALLQSLVGNHALVDGNKRCAWLATHVFYYRNGYFLAAPVDEAFQFVLETAGGRSDVDKIAQSLVAWVRPLP